MVASIEEGGVGGAVQMYTAGGLDSPNTQASVLIQTGYNDLSEETDPRFTATYTTANKAKTLGFMISAAQMERNSWQDGFGTVRWQRPDANFRGERDDAEQPAAPVARGTRACPARTASGTTRSARAWRARSSSARTTSWTST